MNIGIKKGQLVLLLLTICVPLLLNVVALWQEAGTASILQMLKGEFSHPSGYNPQNPLPKIHSSLLLTVAPVGLLAWLMIFISNRVLFQKQPLLARLLEFLLAASIVAKVLEVVAGFFMPLVWLPEIHDYHLGIPVSEFVFRWSRWFVLPSTAVILFIAMLLSGMNKKTGSPSMPSQSEKS